MDDVLGVLVGVAGLLLSAVGGWPLTAAVLRLAARSPDAGPSGAGADGTALPATPDATGAGDAVSPAGEADTGLRGGTWIGILERLAITGTVVAGYPSGIALVIAIKGLGRYPEIREHPATSERFVIGTFASMLWAAVVGAAIRVLLDT